MDHRRFDDITRAVTTGVGSRRDATRALAGGALLAILAHLGRREASSVAGAACRRRNRPCVRDGQCCARGDCRRGRCRCDPDGAPCSSYVQCCSRSCDSRVNGGTCSPCSGQPCAADRDCCGGRSCRRGYCDGCRNRAVVCIGDADCCFSDCGIYQGTRVCLSDFGGTCKRDVDCGGCYFNPANCGAAACVDGRCTT